MGNIRTARWLGLVALLAMFIGPIAVANGAPDKVKEQQVEYAKKLFAEGEAAMAKGDHGTALQKYFEAYRYTPELHLFAYNIGLAAEQLGDCKTALTYYQRFYDLVKKHPKLKEVEKKLKKLKATCIFDEESSEALTTEAQKDHTKSREQRIAERSLVEVERQLARSREMYDVAKRTHKKTRAFARAARRKKWHAKRFRKLVISLGVKPEKLEPTAPVVPGKSTDACRRAASQEKRNAEAFKEVLEYYDTREVYRVMNRLIRGADRRDRPAFENCGL